MKGNHHTYYHLKDIAFLQHEPLLEIFRETRVHEKKIKKAKAKWNKERAERLENKKPSYKLDRLIRERFVLFHFFFPKKKKLLLPCLIEHVPEFMLYLEL